jgi:hypothetical protein
MPEARNPMKYATYRHEGKVHVGPVLAGSKTALTENVWPVRTTQAARRSSSCSVLIASMVG